MAIVRTSYENTAALAAERATPLGLRAAAHMAGLSHGFGKYKPGFDRCLCGDNVWQDHSTVGTEVIGGGIEAIRAALEAARVEFIPRNSGWAGARLRK